MADLLNQYADDATSYKGLLNMATLGQGLTGVLAAITDGMGVNSPLQLSTTNVAVYYPNGTFNGGFKITGGADGGGGTTSFVDFIPNKSTPAYYHAIGFAYDNSNWMGIYRGSRVSPAIAFGNNLIWTPGYDFAIGHTSASARLQVRGDGTNPVVRYEGSSGTASHIFKDTTALEFGTQGNYIAATANGTTTSTAGRGLLFSGVAGQSIYQFNFVASTNGETTGTYGGINLTGGIGIASGSPNFRPLNIAYTINNTGANTGVATGFYLRATETSLNSMIHNFIDLGTTVLGSLFAVTNKGAIKVATLSNADAPNSSLYFSSDASKLVWKDAGGIVNNLY